MIEKKAEFRVLSKRGVEWLDFTHKVLDHIEEYTVPQYGDKPNDPVEEWTAAQCVVAIKKYAARFGSNQRPGQEALDLLKIAHFAQLAFDKLEKERGE